MKFGLQDHHWAVLEEYLIGPLKSHGAEVWVFGSRARGDFRPFSDIDVLYSLPVGGSLSDADLFLMKESLEDSHLPIKVDVVNEAELAQSYRDNVLKDRVKV